jgi:hypothetical protein
MIQLDLFRTIERVELGIDCFDISKVELKIDNPIGGHQEAFMKAVENLNKLPEGIFIMYKTGAYHRDKTKYPDPVFPYLYDNEMERELVVTVNRTSYPALTIPNRYHHLMDVREGYTFGFLIHRLAALCFIENDEPNAKLTVDHIDQDSYNYAVHNLEWVTYSENNRRRRGWKK